MADRIDLDTLAVGGGPIGLTLAMDLARHGVDVTIAEIGPLASRPARDSMSTRTNMETVFL